jgi:hypothetical protein
METDAVRAFFKKWPVRLTQRDPRLVCGCSPRPGVSCCRASGEKGQDDLSQGLGAKVVLP